MKATENDITFLVEDLVRESAGMSEIFSTPLSDVLMIIGIKNWRPFMEWLGTHQSSIEWAKNRSFLLNNGDRDFYNVDEIEQGANKYRSLISLPTLVSCLLDIEAPQFITPFVLQFYGRIVTGENAIAVRVANFIRDYKVKTCDLPSPFYNNMPINRVENDTNN